MKLLKILCALTCLLTSELAIAQVQYGSMVDNRDNHTYRTVKIGNKIWMAENMAIKAAESYPPNGDNDNIPIYGRLYTSHAAKIVCPIGWRLPSRNDFIQLLQTVCGNCNTNSDFFNPCEKKCSFIDFNKHGFMTPPAGLYNQSGADFGFATGFLSSTGYDDSRFYVLGFVIHDKIPAVVDEMYSEGLSPVFLAPSGKTSAYSVRCLRDSN